MRHRNFAVLLIVSILFGLAGGIYEFVLPYYLAARGLSFLNMGYVFAVAPVALFMIRLGLGKLADRWGSRRLYSAALITASLAVISTPLATGVLALIALKTLREIGVLGRNTAHPLLLYEEGASRFAGFIGRTRGMESLFQAAGTFAAGWGLVSLGYGATLGTGGAALGVGAMLLLAVKGGRPKPGAAGEREGGLRSLLDFRLPRNLQVIMAANFVFSIGLSTSHCFIMPLFFSQKFSADPSQVSTVMVIHRLTAVAPLLLAGYLPRRHYRTIYIGAFVMEGLTLAAGALIPVFGWAAAVWLLHDLLGAGLWIPIQSAIIQDECRDDTRGADLSKTLAFSALGGALGPLLAGHLSGWSLNAPFLVSGALITASAGILCGLRLRPAAVASSQQPN